ncbi:hypothetical protein [Kineococcus arenarius]|uniref:hypothetical protein n=1 Tax=Kineococcus sp. SYSU DK007 TaxID=3383128 RepID=UPI003D7E027F
MPGSATSSNGRPTDWSPLAAVDPVPGDPDEVSRSARRFRDVADTLAEQAAALDRLADDSSQVAKTVGALKETSASLSARLRGAVERYRSTADALAAYERELGEAQGESAGALVEARDAEARQHAAHAALRASSGTVPLPAPGADAAAVAARESAEEQRVAARGLAQACADEAAEDLAAARQRLDLAVEARDEAAERARRAVEAACDGDALADRWYDAVLDALDPLRDWSREHTDLLRLVADVAGVVATVAGVVAFVAAFVPGGQAVAAVAAVVSAAAGVVSLAAHLLLLLADEASWKDVAGDVVGLATLGLGKVGVLALKTAAPVLRDLPRTATAVHDASSLAVRRFTEVAGRVGGTVPEGTDVAALARRLATEGGGDLKREVAALLGTSTTRAKTVVSATRGAWRSVDAGARAVQDLAAARLRMPTAGEFWGFGDAAWRPARSAAEVVEVVTTLPPAAVRATGRATWSFLTREVPREGGAALATGVGGTAAAVASWALQTRSEVRGLPEKVRDVQDWVGGSGR